MRLRLLAGIALLVAGGYQAAVTSMFVNQLRWPENDAEAGFTLVSPWPTIGTVSDAARAGGLAAGQSLVAVQGAPFQGRITIDRALEKLFPGDRIRVTVRDGAGEREVSYQVTARSDRPLTAGRMAFVWLMTIGMPVLCLVVGFWTVFVRPRERQAWLLLAMLGCFAHSVVHPGAFPERWGMTGDAFHVLHTAMNGSWPLFMFVFGWSFPRRTAWQERSEWAKWTMVALLVAGAGMLVAQDVLSTWGDPARWAGMIDGLRGMLGKVQLVQMFGIGLFFALLSYKRWALEDIDSKRRLQTIVMGAMVALTPLFLLLLGALAGGWKSNEIPGYLTVPALLAMCVFPVTLAYVIVVHRAFGVGVVIRQGLRYALARRGVRVLQVLLILGVMLTAVYMASQPGMSRPRILQVVAVGTVFVLFLQRGADWLGRWVDRRFFREAYQAEQVLAHLSEDVRTMVETQPLLEAVATRIGEALHVDRIALLVRNGSGFEPAYAMGPAPDGLGAGARTAEVMERQRRPLRVYLDDAGSWIRKEGVPAEETEWLRGAGAELLLPLAVKDKLLGFASLGPKRSEEPYTGSDLRLLESVAVQAGLALENSRLAAEMSEAVAQRERLHREVEIAGEVQERLFPQVLPEIAGLDYWGYCRPARGVGGDSYDFLELENGQFAFSIGDVSGKGIPASLLMASLQSALRGQAMSMPGDLGAMMGRMNRLIYDSSPSNRYATLFYGQYDPGTRELRYVNGGHCPPMVVRRGEVLRLEEGGPVVGLFRPGVFGEGRVVLEAGDVLVGFTDGVSEAMNGADEEWGEEALAEFLRARAGKAARELIPEIVAGADAFAAGTPQHDDMTLIVVRVLG